MKHPMTLLLGLTLVAAPCSAAQELELKTEQDKINYSVGYQIGDDFKRQNLELSPEALVKGIEDALAGAKPLMSEGEMQTTLVELKKKIVAGQETQRKQASARDREEGARFLQENAQKKGVVVLPSGLQYKVVRQGTGKQPTIDDKVTVNYRGTLIDGKEFDNSYERGEPLTIALNKVMRGWQEALPLMKEGAKWELFIPSKLAFGETGPLEGKVVLYEVELLAVEPAGAKVQPTGTAPKN